MRRMFLLVCVFGALALASCDEGSTEDNKNLPDTAQQEDGTGTETDGVTNELAEEPDTYTPPADLVTPGACASDLDCLGKKCCDIDGEKVCMTQCPGTTGACQSDLDCLGKKCCTVNGENVCLTTCPGVTPEGCQSDADCGGQKCCDDGAGGKECMAQCPGTTPEGCQSDLDCAGGQKCCPASIPMMPSECKADCGGSTGGCTADTDCPGGQKCCPATIPMMPSECKAECGGGLATTCSSNDDCVGGQTCKDLMGMAALCISECTDDSNCNGNTCKDLGAMGMSLAKVCECTDDASCPDAALKCCKIDLLGFISVNTCLTECIDLGSLLGGLGM